MKDDPDNDNNSSVCPPVAAGAEPVILTERYGPDPNFDPVLSRWNESAG